jgi:hypothetical protein
MKTRLLLLGTLILATLSARAFSFLCECPVNVDEIPQASWQAFTASPDGVVLELTLTNGAVLISTNSGAMWTAKAASSASSNTVPPLVSGTADAVSTPSVYRGATEGTRPSLSIAISSEGIVLSWPSAFAHFQPEQSFDIRHADWQSVTNVIAVTNGHNRVTMLPSGGSAFFRLNGP